MPPIPYFYGKKEMELGFRGERFLHLNNKLVEMMENSPLTSDLYIYALGYFPSAAYHYIYRPNGCDEWVLKYCTKGVGWIELYGKRMALTENHFIILPKGVPHRYYADHDNPWTIYWMHIRGSKAAILSQGFDKPTEVHASQDFQPGEKSNLFEEIFQTLNEGLTLRNMHYANLCLAHLMATFCLNDVLPKDFRPKEYSENVIKYVVQYMNENVEKNLTLDDFTAFCGYSPSYFYRKFVKETGCAPMKYFMRLKIDKACFFLINTDMKATQIAYRLGFRDPQHFARVFTAAVGMSAWKFRKQQWNE
ncbi:MAG: helix-turn-helix domain-containing protein [Bacteroidaceae bacterium]|nr:helix-turn-helix domain-containing protein [Bacteroidaceae bacterium]